MKNESSFDEKLLSSFNYNWSLAKKYGSIIDKEDARVFLIKLLDNWDKINLNAVPIWIDLIERAGFYPYYIEKINKTNHYNQSFKSCIRSSVFKSKYLDDIYFHQEQKRIEMAISAKHNVAVSAPTSFGKSLLIEEFVARKKYDNILIIQPTLALIDETRKKVNKYSDYYNIVVNTKQLAEKRNIFILTAERVLEYSELPKIDFFVVDEFYKVSNLRKDNRLDALNVSIMKIMEHKPQALFLTPCVDALSKKFINKYSIKFYKTNYSLVNTNVNEVRYAKSKKESKLFSLLQSMKEPTIVYVKSSNEAYSLASKYINYIGSNHVINNSLSIYQWIDQNISADWKLKNFLMHGIGIHTGTLPRHIGCSEIDLFNNGTLSILFATTSLIEGVNTVAKNIIIYSKNKGNRALDSFDIANIKGRAGRMSKYYTGNVYLFNEDLAHQPFEIDVPFIDQIDISDEVLLNIPDDQVKDKDRKKSLEYGIPNDLKDIIKANLISVEGQKELYYYLDSNIDKLGYLKWENVPTYDQLYKTLYLAYKFLDSGKNEKFAKAQSIKCLNILNGSVSSAINKQTKYLISKNKNNSNRRILHNKAINDILKFLRNDAGYTIPKLLTVLDSIKKYVLEKKGYSDYGDYGIFCSKLQHENIDENFAFLIDFGIPSSAIKKIQQFYKNDSNEKTKIILWIKENQQELKKKLLKYEYEMIEKALDI